MFRLQNISIRRKQMIIIMLTSGVTLLLAGAAFITCDVLNVRRQLVRQAATTAEMVGNNCTASLDFNDRQSAADTLACLRAEPNIRLAGVYDQRGALFARFIRDTANGASVFPSAGAEGSEFDGDTLRVFKPIVVSGERAGTIYLAYDLDEVRARVVRFAGIAVLVLVASLAAGFVLSTRLQRVISDPILHLAQMARAVAKDKNYSVRAAKYGEDELGELIDGFNEMLTQIQARDLELQTARDLLERRVEERTSKLAESLSLLNATLESTADGILVVDLNGRIASYNSKFVEMWRLPAREVETHDDTRLIEFVRAQLVDEAAFVNRVREFYADPDREGLDVLKLKDGRLFERYSQPQRLAERVVGRVWCFRDITDHMRAEEALRESQALYYSLVEQLPVGVFRKDKAGRFVFVNPAFCKIKGLSAEQFLGRTAGDVVSRMVVVEGDSSENFGPALQGAEHHKHIMQTGQQIEIEEHYPDQQDHGQHLHVIKSPVFDGAGEIVGSQGILVDITQRKQAEAALAHERYLLHALLDTSPDAIYFKDLNSRFIRCSKSQAAAFGFDNPEDVIGRTDFDFFDEEHARPALEDEQHIIRTGEAIVGKVEPEVWKSGEKTWAITSKMPLRDAQGNIIGTFGISKDITELRRAQEAAALEQARFKFIFESVPIGISLAKSGPDGRLLERLINDAHLRICGLTPEQDRDFTIYGKLTHPDDARRQEVFSRQVAAGEINQFSIEKRYVRFDGQTVWVLFSFARQRHAGGVVEDLCTVVDITKSKSAEEEREKYHRQLLDASRMAGMAEVASNVLHNVGNVLNSVNVSATLVADNLKKSKARNLGRVVKLLDEHAADLAGFLTGDSRGRQLPDYLRELDKHLTQEQEGITAELESLRNNIGHIKDVVAMQQNYAKVSGQTEVLDVTGLIEDSLRINAGALERHNVRVIREFAAVPAIDVDKHKVLQILVNVIRNAKYACDEGGRADKQMTVRLSHDADWLRIAVLDNGVGIPAENLMRIFNHGFTTRKTGHGFGLHSGALAAREMGGALLVHSDGPGCGAMFTLELPVRRGADSDNRGGIRR